MKRLVALLALILSLLTGCSDSTSSHQASPAPAKPLKKLVSEKSHSQGPALSGPVVINLAKLWGGSRKQVERALRRHRLTEHDPVPQDYPDAIEAGGEIRAYRLDGETEVTVGFNSQGYATIVSVGSVGNRNSLGFDLNHWKNAFHKYGLPDCGTPAKTAPEAYYWGPPYNRTGGSEIEVFANERGQIWQVQARSPEDFFPK